MTSQLFHGICASTVTPFHADGRVNFAAIQPHVDWIVAEGANAISPLGSSGEFVAVEGDDRKRVLETAIDANNGRVPVVAGTHSYSTAKTIEYSQHAESAGADACLIVPPYYMAPTNEQTKDHYRRIAAAISIPIVLYHSQSMTLVDLTTEDLAQLFEEQVIGGVKMSNHSPDRIASLLQATGGDLTVYAGIDTVAFEGLSHGCHGWISGIPSSVPRVAQQLYQAIAVKSDMAEARKIWRKLAPLMRLQFTTSDVNWFSVMKAALNMIGPPVGDPCPPILPLPAEPRKQLAQILKDLGYEVA